LNHKSVDGEVGVSRMHSVRLTIRATSPFGFEGYEMLSYCIGSAR